MDITLLTDSERVLIRLQNTSFTFKNPNCSIRKVLHILALSRSSCPYGYVQYLVVSEYRSVG